MKKVLILVMAILLFMLPVFAAGTSEAKPAQKEIKLRFGTTSGESTVVVKTMRDFSEIVSKKTDGNITVEVFPASQLGSVDEMAQNAQMGAIDMCMTQPARLAAMGVKEMSVLVLPYIFSGYEQRWNVIFGGIGQELLDKVTSNGNKLVGFGYFPDGARNFFTVKNKPIRKLADVKGMKLRVQATEMDNDMCIALGASPTPTASSEMYSSIQSGIVDGAEQPIANFYASKFYEVSSFLTLDEHTYNTLVVLFSEITWNKLDAEQRNILTASWNEAVAENKKVILDTEASYLSKMKDVGVEVITLTDHDAWVKAMEPVYAKHGKGFEDLIARIRAVK